MPFTFIANSPYARDAVELGRVVVNVDSPLQEYFQPRAKPSVSHHNFTSIHDAIPASDRSRLAIYLSRLFTVSYDEVSDHAVVINTSAASTYELKNSTLWFDDLRASGKGRIWLSKQAASRRSLHLVVGYVVVKDVHIAQMDGTLSLGNIKLQIPPAALTGVGAAVNTVISELGDVGIKIQHFSQQLQEGSFIASGEQILAIEYRTIRVGMFRSRDV